MLQLQKKSYLKALLFYCLFLKVYVDCKVGVFFYNMQFLTIFFLFFGHEVYVNNFVQF